MWRGLIRRARRRRQRRRRTQRRVSSILHFHTIVVPIIDRQRLSNFGVTREPRVTVCLGFVYDSKGLCIWLAEQGAVHLVSLLGSKTAPDCTLGT